MPSRLIFRCQFCDAQPDPDTQASLESQVRVLLFGEYLDAPPEGWLTWTGRGICGPVRYACAGHRDELQAYVRRHYGSVAWQAKKEGPFPRYPPPGSKRTGPASDVPKWGLG